MTNARVFQSTRRSPVIAQALRRAALAVLLAIGVVGNAAAPAQAQDCCTEHGGAGCSDTACATCVCDLDSSCCDSSWDLFCVATALDDCADTCPCNGTPVPTATPDPECCAAHASPGCADSECQACVCTADGLCCSSAWDASCVGQALGACAASCDCVAPTPSPTPEVSDCCVGHEGGGCSDSACEACVCAADSFCCNEWDQTCADEAAINCALDCPCPAPGSCCDPHETASCDDLRCRDCVCDRDAFCCSEEWDQGCADQATNECALDCACEPAGDCCSEHDGVGCDVLACQDCVCEQDAACCDEGWDGRCAMEAELLCPEACPACVPSNCCTAREETGCNQDACEACVCTVDAFCCNEMWDPGCVDIATGDCPDVCGCAMACPGDCDGDGEVTVSNLILAVNIALGTASIDQCPAIDTDGSGDVTVNELIQAVNAALNGCP